MPPEFYDLLASDIFKKHASKRKRIEPNGKEEEKNADSAADEAENENST